MAVLTFKKNNVNFIFLAHSVRGEVMLNPLRPTADFAESCREYEEWKKQNSTFSFFILNEKLHRYS
jgi:hypothetical protein